MTDDEIRLKQKDRLIVGLQRRYRDQGRKLFAKRRESTKGIPTKELVKIIFTRLWQRLSTRHH